jgi:spore coat protein CotH
MLKARIKNTVVFCVFLSLGLASSLGLSSQSDFYSCSQVREIRIYFSDSNWKYYLDSLFSAGDKNSRIKADVEIDGILYKECGVRYKGFSSWNPDETKNPFSINLDYTFKNQNHEGYKKLKLSNVIYDPSFLREVLAYGIARKYMPAPEANFANLYINDTLIGLYSNVEAVDECFTEKHFSCNDNAFFKGNPENLVYPFGQNANLNYYEGDSSVYFPYYSIESDYGWEQLSDFIYVLNKDTAKISTVLNVDRALWMHAFNYSLLNLDSYIAYAQNYYLFCDDNGQFNTIPWDMNMSFGSFRHSDGATNFSGVTMAKLPILNPLQAATFSISPRPLMKNLLLNSRYRKMYMAHIRTIMEQNIADSSFVDEAEILHELIADYVEADTNKFYSNADFEANIYSLTGASTDQYPGIQDVMLERYAYLRTVAGYLGYPVYQNHFFDRERAMRGESLSVSANFELADKVYLYYRCSSDTLFTQVEMTGNNDDEHEFFTTVVPNGLKFEYYFWAENDSAGAFYPEEAAYKFLDLPVRLEYGDLAINEVFYELNSDSYSISKVESVEIYNPNSETLNLVEAKIFCNEKSYLIPDTCLSENGFITIDLNQIADVHDFASNPDDYISLIDDNLTIDSLQFYNVSINHSFGRYPDGNLVYSFLEPTPSCANRCTENVFNNVAVYPNPAQDYIAVDFVGRGSIKNIKIVDSEGKTVFFDDYSEKNFYSSEIDIRFLSSGLYYIIFECDNSLFNTKFAKI